MIYFHGVMPDKYVPVWPVFVVDDEPERLRCLVAIDVAYGLGGGLDAPYTDVSTLEPTESSLSVRRYVAGLTRRRLHQTAFREHVVSAYQSACAMCRLRRGELVDAAHIIPDGEPGGEPIVPNGLCLCKIHHAAFDQKVIGVSPDYRMEVRDDIRRERDGPMLRHGLQELHGALITVPTRKSQQPDRDRLSWRYDAFRAAS